MDASALRWRPERRLTLFRSRVVFLSFSSLPCFCTFYSSIPTQNEVFFRTFFPLVYSRVHELPLVYNKIDNKEQLQ